MVYPQYAEHYQATDNIVTPDADRRPGMSRAYRVARRVRTGTFTQNIFRFDPSLPFGGWPLAKWKKSTPVVVFRVMCEFARARAFDMTRNMFIAAALVLSCGLTACVATGPTRAVATPWGALAFHSFAQPKAPEPNAKAVNADVARLLDEQEGSGTLVAAR